MPVNNTFSLEGNLVDILQQKTYPARVLVEDGIIKTITELTFTAAKSFLLPGFKFCVSNLCIFNFF